MDSTTHFDSTGYCRPDDPVLLYVHCSWDKPDPHVKIRRQTTLEGIPPVILGKLVTLTCNAKAYVY